MPNTTERVEIITGRERRRRYSAEHKLALVEETMLPGMTVSAVARIHGVSPSLLFNWRRLMIQVSVAATPGTISVDGSVPARAVFVYDGWRRKRLARCFW
jgi:transposase-like protein